MKKVKDKFSKQAAAYKKYRPTYPNEFYTELLQLTHGRNDCWDCGTGNGQVAIELSAHFKRVYATDISKNQIANAPKRDNIIYGIERAERTSFKADQFDLITVAQALHWFDLDGFNSEMKRVAKNGAVVGIWGYGLLGIEKPIDKLINHFYKEIVGPYWNSERKHVDDAYQSISLDFEEIELKKQYHITVNWTLKALEGYLSSWSSVQNYITENAENPIPSVIEEIRKYWKKDTTKEIKFPIFTRIGRILK